MGNAGATRGIGRGRMEGGCGLSRWPAEFGGKRTGGLLECRAPWSTLPTLLSQKRSQWERPDRLTESNLSLLKSGRVKGVRFGTLAAICHFLQCKPGDILGYERSDEDARCDGDQRG